MTHREKFEAWYKENKAGPFDFITKRLCWGAWQAALASQQPADDGWIAWAGVIAPDEQPVDGMVEVNFRNGVISKLNAAMVSWTHDGIEADIIAYRLVKP